MQATRMDLECRRDKISWWEFWIPLQLNCRMVPAKGTWLEGVGDEGRWEGEVKKVSVEEEEGGRDRRGRGRCGGR